MRQWILGASVLALASCGDTEAPVEAEAKAATLPAGEWEVNSTVQTLRSTDKTTPDVALKQGDTATSKVCIAEEGGKADLTALLPAGDKCKATSVYARNGRINAAYNCTRPGKPGQVMPAMDGKFTADTIEAVITTGTYFSGSGDYTLVQKITGKRVGDCAAAAKPA